MSMSPGSHGRVTPTEHVPGGSGAGGRTAGSPRPGALFHGHPLRADKVGTCPTAGRTPNPFRPRGSGVTPKFCPCGGTACAAQMSRQMAARLFAGGLFTEDRRRPIAQWYNPARMSPPSWWPRRAHRNGRCSGSASFTHLPAAASPKSTPRRTSGIRANPGSPPPRSKHSRPPSPKRNASSRWRCTSSERGASGLASPPGSASPAGAAKRQHKKVPRPVFATGRGNLSAPPAGLEPATLRLNSRMLCQLS